VLFFNRQSGDSGVDAQLHVFPPHFRVHRHSRLGNRRSPEVALLFTISRICAAFRREELYRRLFPRAKANTGRRGGERLEPQAMEIYRRAYVPGVW